MFAAACAFGLPRSEERRVGNVCTFSLNAAVLVRKLAPSSELLLYVSALGGGSVSVLSAVFVAAWFALPAASLPLAIVTVASPSAPLAIDFVNLQTFASPVAVMFAAACAFGLP